MAPDQPWLNAAADACILHIKVTPNAAPAGCFGVVTDPAGQQWLRVRIPAAPERGKANQSLIKWLAKTTGLPKSSFSLIAGDKEKAKKVRVIGEPAWVGRKIAGTMPGRDRE